MKVYNTLTKKNENLLPVHAPCVAVYVQDTTSKRQHLGRAVDDVRCSAIQRYLLYKGYEVEYIEKGAKHADIIICPGLLHVDGVAMLESRDNLLTVEDGLEKYGKELLTWVILRHHYRASIDLNDQLFRDNLNILRDFYIHISPSVMEAAIERPHISDPIVKELFKDFETEMDNDFNTPGALVLLARYLEKTVSLRSKSENTTSRRLEEAIVYLGRILGLFQSENLASLTGAMLIFQQQVLRTPEIVTVENINLLVKDREKARHKKEYARADHICNLLRLHGVAVVDGNDKNTWKFTAH